MLDDNLDNTEADKLLDDLQPENVVKEQAKDIPIEKIAEVQKSAAELKLDESIAASETAVDNQVENETPDANPTSEVESSDESISTSSVTPESAKNSEESSIENLTEEVVLENSEPEETGTVNIETEAKIDSEIEVKNTDSNTSETEEVAEVSPDKEPVKAPEKVDYTTLSMEELVGVLQKEVKQEIPKIRSAVEEIKKNFQSKFNAILKEKKEAFLGDGGNEIDFKYSNPIKSAYNDLMFEYKTRRDSYYKGLEDEQKTNLSLRLTLIEDLKHLIDNAEPETMYNEFRALQDRWRVIGKIPRAKYNDVWRTYHHHVERFYDLLHLRNDFRDLDFKHNLEEKLKLTEKAEALVDKADLNSAFKELQLLHKMWKEDIGPVAREFREDIWNRFSKATKKIHEKRHEFQKVLESKFEDNVVLKRDVIAKISSIVQETSNESHKFWQQKIKDLEALRQDFFKIGNVPKAVNDKIWNEFKDATRTFNRQKNTFYKNIKQEQHQNLEKKKVLVTRAEELKESDDWEMATEIMKQIQAEWKKVGHVPRKYSDKLWKRFKSACNHYFDRLHNEQDVADKEQVEVFNQKKEMLERLKTVDADLSIEAIKKYSDEWHALGSLPFNMRHLEAKFSKVVNGMYGKLNLDAKEIAMLKFRNLVDTYYAQGNAVKLDGEKMFVRKKIDEVTKEIQQLENNVSFFSNAQADNPLFKGVNDNIEKFNGQLKIWKAKSDYLSKLDY